jgi:hypothetical protein
MSDGLIVNGKRYITTREAARLTGYAPDYVGQLCRGGKLDCSPIGRSWFVAEESIIEHKKKREAKVLEPALPLLPPEAQKRYLPIMPKQLLLDVAGIASIFLLSLGFAWGMESGKLAQAGRAVKELSSSSAAALAVSVKVEAPRFFSELKSAQRTLVELSAAPAFFLERRYQDLISSAAAGAELLGGGVLEFSSANIAAAGASLGEIAYALPEAYLAVVTAAGPGLLSLGNSVLDAHVFMLEEAGKGLALLSESLLVGHSLAISFYGDFFPTAFSTLGDAYLAGIGTLGGALASATYGLLDGYLALVDLSGDKLAGAAFASALAGADALDSLSASITDVLLAYQSIVEGAGESLYALSEVGLALYADTIDRVGGSIGTLTLGTMSMYERIIHSAGSGLALSRDALLSGYLSGVETAGTALGTSMQPTFAFMMEAVQAGKERIARSADSYFASLSALDPFPLSVQEVGGAPLPEGGAAVAEGRQFGELASLKLNAELVLSELSLAFDALLVRVGGVAAVGNLAHYNLGAASGTDAGFLSRSLDRLALSTYRFIAPLVLKIKYDSRNLFTITPKDGASAPAEETGVVITGSQGAALNAAEIARIKSIFSDEVEVRPDSTGTAGIVKPIFRKKDGEDFLYVLVPIQK